jgi:hypothetical protein
MLPEVTRKVQPPRALVVPYSLGYPLGAPDAPDVQTRILRALLRLVEVREVPCLEVLHHGG